MYVRKADKTKRQTMHTLQAAFSAKSQMHILRILRTASRRSILSSQSSSPSWTSKTGRQEAKNAGAKAYLCSNRQGTAPDKETQNIRATSACLPRPNPTHHNKT